jgi:hypothetical protein
VDIEVESTALEVGQTGAITLMLSAPSGVALTIEQGLPAGARVEATQVSGHEAVTTAEVKTDRVMFTTRPFRAAETMEVTIAVQPAFSGRFSTVPLRVQGDRGQVAYMEPTAWTVR